MSETTVSRRTNGVMRGALPLKAAEDNKPDSDLYDLYLCEAFGTVHTSSRTTPFARSISDYGPGSRTSQCLSHPERASDHLDAETLSASASPLTSMDKYWCQEFGIPLQDASTVRSRRGSKDSADARCDTPNTATN